ncbi:MAG: bifunctional folylpolyglutamate synthase/dihydrofolate synthase [Roseimicrobium sp.]
MTQQEIEALDWLYSTQRFGIKLGLENVLKLMGAVGVPAPGQRFIHVAGTNGKGSVCALLHSLLKAADVNAGLFTSPHLIHFRERIRDAEREIAPGEIVRGIELLRSYCEGWVPYPTFFELAFVLALDWFRKRQREWVVLETGMGGRLDATNAVTPDVCVITPIALDHQKYLGESLKEIAAEKAGIIKPGVPVVTLKQPPEAMAVIAETARARGAPLTIVTTPLRGYQIGLFGQHQLWNATLAVAAFRAASFKPLEPVLRHGLRDVHWPARFQRFESGRIILDGAHNPDSAETLARTWMQAYPGEKAATLFGACTDKDLRGVLRALQPITSHWLFTGFDNPRAVAQEKLREELSDLYGRAVTATTHDNIPSALASARGRPQRTLITGSLYLAGEALAYLTGMRSSHQVSVQ